MSESASGEAASEVKVVGAAEGGGASPNPGGAEAGQPAGVAEGSGQPVPAATGGGGSAGSPPPAPDWRDRRLDKLTGTNKELRAQIDQMERRLQELAGGARPPQGEGASAGPVPGTAEFDRLVSIRASEQAALLKFNSDCASVAEAGRKNFSDFDAKISALGKTVDQSDPKGQTAYVNMLRAAMDVGGDTAGLLYKLAQDPERAERIIDMPPTKQAIELTRLAAGTVKGVGGASETPKPIAPVSGAGGSTAGAIDPTDPTRADKLSTKEWMERRTKQVKDRFAPVAKGA